MSRFPIDDWQVEQTRLTVFPMPDASLRSTDWWQVVTESKPDEMTTNPKKGSAVVQGAFDPGKLILKFEPDRIDWVLTPPDVDMEEVAAAHEFPKLGSVAEMISVFSNIAEAWLRQDDLPEIARMAFGAVLMHPEEDRRSGYSRLPDYVPVKLDPESSDFLYQINLPPLESKTGIDGLLLNRLTKWSVLALRYVAVRVTRVGVNAKEPTSVAHALRLELDINTVPSFEGPIPHAQLVDIYRELVSHGLDIATNGVIRE